jgi:hypothetical protein
MAVDPTSFDQLTSGTLMNRGRRSSAFGRTPHCQSEQRTTNDARSAKASNEQSTTPSPPKRATNNQRRPHRQSEQQTTNDTLPAKASKLRSRLRALKLASAQTRERSKLAPSAPKRATNNQRRPHRQSEQVAKQVASAQTRERSNTHPGQNGISSSWMPE